MPDIAPIDVCSIPTGDHTLGDARYPSSRPQHTVHLAAYHIAQDAVTNHLYAEFVLDGGYDDPQWWTELGQRWLKSKQINQPHFWSIEQFGHPEQPVVGISWYEALAFTRWLSHHTGQPWRLPTEAEWEAAAQGADTNSGRINTAEQLHSRPLRIDEPDYRPNVSRYGARHMLGNVYEWCSTRWGHNWQSLDYPYPYDPDDGREDLDGSHARVMRGGSWFDPIQMAHPSYRARYLPGSRGSNIGFRLCYTPDA